MSNSNATDAQEQLAVQKEHLEMRSAQIDSRLDQVLTGINSLSHLVKNLMVALQQTNAVNTPLSAVLTSQSHEYVNYMQNLQPDSSPNTDDGEDDEEENMDFAETDTKVKPNTQKKKKHRKKSGVIPTFRYKNVLPAEKKIKSTNKEKKPPDI